MVRSHGRVREDEAEFLGFLLQRLKDGRVEVHAGDKQLAGRAGANTDPSEVNAWIRETLDFGGLLNAWTPDPLDSAAEALLEGLVGRSK